MANLSPEMFTVGENQTQHYYFFNNEVTKELVQIIRLKKEKHWFGVYENKKTERFFTIPINTDDNYYRMLEKVCEWYISGRSEKEERQIPEVKVNKISKTLEGITNMFGKFPPQSALRIQAYLNNPCVDLWDDIHGVLINGEDTLWQLLTEIDHSFPKRGRSEDITGKIVDEWERIPTELEVLRAIKSGNPITSVSQVKKRSSF